jgi:hypothetical protein
MRHAWARTLQPAGGFHFYVVHPAFDSVVPLRSGLAQNAGREGDETGEISQTRAWGPEWGLWRSRIGRP